MVNGPLGYGPSQTERHVALLKTVTHAQLPARIYLSW